MRQHQLLALLFTLLLSLSACSAAGPAATPEPQGEGAAPLLARIRTLAASASCTEASQCKSVAIGARACGGPEGYLAYSTTLTNPAQLLALVLHHAEQQRAKVASAGLLSTCAMLSDPGATCLAGTCQLRSATSDPS